MQKWEKSKVLAMCSVQIESEKIPLHQGLQEWMALALTNLMNSTSDKFDYFC